MNFQRLTKLTLRISVAVAALLLVASIAHATIAETGLYTSKWAVAAVFVPFMLVLLAALANFALLLLSGAKRNWQALSHAFFGGLVCVMSTITAFIIDASTLVYIT